jgi:hypothetical protein
MSMTTNALLMSKIPASTVNWSDNDAATLTHRKRRREMWGMRHGAAARWL